VQRPESGLELGGLAERDIIEATGEEFATHEVACLEQVRVELPAVVLEVARLFGDPIAGLGLLCVGSIDPVPLGLEVDSKRLELAAGVCGTFVVAAEFVGAAVEVLPALAPALELGDLRGRSPGTTLGLLRCCLGGALLLRRSVGQLVGVGVRLAQRSVIQSCVCAENGTGGLANGPLSGLARTRFVQTLLERGLTPSQRFALAEVGQALFGTGVGFGMGDRFGLDQAREGVVHAPKRLALLPGDGEPAVDLGELDVEGLQTVDAATHDRCDRGRLDVLVRQARARVS